ncbi:MAG: MlaD family protein [Polyangiaceae bacterium]
MSAARQKFKVGVFTSAALLIATVAVFLIGDNRRMWDRKMTYHAKYDDVVGLRAGSVVRMGGVDIGTVTSVSHAESATDSKIYVELSIARREAVRVRKGSIARVVNKGLLGDKMVDVTAGPPTEPALPDGAFIPTEEPMDIGKAFSKFESMADKADKTLDNVEKITTQLGDPKLTEDLKGTVSSLRIIFDGVANNKNGAAHKLIFDEEEAKRVDRLLINLESATGQLSGAAADVHQITTQAKTGPGLVHTMVYDEATAKSASGVISELNQNLAAIRTGNGLLHSLVYGDDKTQRVMGNVNAMSDDLRVIVANMRAGKGTIGALLVDPSVYEDIKSIVGNVERNQVLRALVRYSIKKNEEAPKVEVKAPDPAPKK